MSKRKLLLADDSVTIQKVVNLTFADEGVEVFTVSNGTAAIEKLHEVEPDLVLADVHMPGLNGYEVCEQVKQSERFSHVPVMLLVGSFEPFDEAEMKRVGANDFLTKPFQSIRQLVQKVNSLLDAASAPVNSEIPASFNAATPFAIDEAENLDNPLPTVSTAFAGNTGNFNYFADNDRNESKFSLGDAGMDDEMIETSAFNQAVAPETTELAADEIKIYEYDFSNDTGTENEIIAAEAAAVKPAEEIRPTMPLSIADIQEIGSSMLSPMHTAENETLLTIDAETVLETPAETQNQPAANDFGYESNFSQTVEPTAFEFQKTYVPDDVLDIEPEVQTTEFDYYQAGVETLEETEDDAVLNFNEVQTIDNYSSETQVEASNAGELENGAVNPYLIDEFDEDSLLDLQFETEFDAPFPDELRTDDSLEVDQTTLQDEATDNNNTPSISYELLPPERGDSTPQMLNESAQTAIAQAGMQAVSAMNLQFPPEVIEAIAQKVVEKLSDKVIEKIAWEIVPDRFDLIVRKHIEGRER